jgi:hypothetical protein
LAKSIYLIAGAIVLFVSLLLINQISPFNLADQKELKTEQVAENEAADINVTEENADEDVDEESDSKEPSSGSSTVPISGSGFKHEVQMNTDGVVKKNQDEGWWEIE